MLSIWRYSHLTLAISTALFVAVASLTGIILAFEPIYNKFNPAIISNLENITVAETIKNLQENYKEVVSISVDEDSYVKATVITNTNRSETFLVNPKSGIKIAAVNNQSPIFRFTTNLHRSLFLKSTGRILVAFFTFLFLLLTIAGFGLLLQRQGGFKKLFTKTIKEDSAQFYHVVFSKYAFIPIVIIAITGVYLSLEKFNLLPKTKEKTVFFEKDTAINNKNFSDFEVFKTTTLDQVKQLDFPFSKDKEDYFYLKLANKEVAIHQYYGTIVSEKKAGIVAILSVYSLWLHTGRGDFLWAFVLLLTCVVICYFIYSGFVIYLKRKHQSTILKNTFTKDEAEIILLVGSETGSTNRFANAFFKGLINANKKVFVDALNNYNIYKKAKHIVVFTATYGDGDAPANASLFLKKFSEVYPTNNIQFSVVGFGSSNYPKFCKYAILVNASLQLHEKFIPILPLFTVDNQSKTAFKNWVKEWSTFYKIHLNIDDQLLIDAKEKLEFKVLEKSEVNEDDTFTIQLKPKNNTVFYSGDLLSILPKSEVFPRLYSIAKIRNTIVLSIKKHELGACSNWLNTLKVGEELRASIQKNESFYFPKKAKEVLLIANGTGVAPFLGMIQNNPDTKIHLFLGVRSNTSLAIYKPYIKSKNLTTIEVVFSRENGNSNYVQNLVLAKKDLVIRILEEGNSIMLCGSLAMQKEVFSVLTLITETNLSTYINKNQIKTDCY